MSTVQEMVNSLVRKGPTFLRYGFILQIFVGVLLCGLGYFMGRAHLRLILKGERAQGRIVDYKRRIFTISRSNQPNSTSTGYMPVVEYRAMGDKRIRFEDWLGKSPGMLNESVPVLYDRTDPSVAMIDRPVWNWMPWAPTLAVGLFLVLVGIRRGLRFALITT
jgi:hypothetical protein